MDTEISVLYNIYLLLMLSSLCFPPQSLKNIKTILIHRLYKSSQKPGFGPWSVVCWFWSSWHVGASSWERREMGVLDPGQGTWLKGGLTVNASATRLHIELGKLHLSVHWFCGNTFSFFYWMTWQEAIRIIFKKERVKIKANIPGPSPF